MDENKIAQQAKYMTKAIFTRESKMDYNAVGDNGTSHGAGQWQPDTWKAHAKEVLGDENAPMTPDNQSVVAQGVIRNMIKNGKNAAQIAAIWNSGSDTGWENKIGTKTYPDGTKIDYNVPQYVKDVTDLYHQIKPQQITEPDIKQKRESMVEAGQPVSVNPEKAEPTFAGSLIRGILKTPARIATNLVQAGDILTGGKGDVQPFSGNYLGEVKPIGQEGTFGQKVKESVGAGLEMASYLPMAQGLKGVMAAKNLGTPLLRAGLSTGIEGAVGGAMGGVGQGMAENKKLGAIAGQGLVGGIGGGILGSVAGVGGSLAGKMPGVVAKHIPERMQGAINEVKNAYLEALESTKTGTKILAKDEMLHKDTINDLVDERLIPKIKGSRLDATETIKKAEQTQQAFNDLMGEAIKVENKQININQLESKLMERMSKFTDDADEVALMKQAQKRIAELKSKGDITDLVRIQNIKNKASMASKGMYNPLIPESTAVKKRVEKELFYATKDLINENTSPNIQTINDQLEKYHRISDTLEFLNGSVVKGGKIGKYVAETLGGLAGSQVGGIPGTVVGMRIAEYLTNLRMQSAMGSASARKILESLESKSGTVFKEVKQALATIEKQKGLTPLLKEPSYIPMKGETQVQEPMQVLQANKNPVTVNPKTNKFQRSYNSSGKPIKGLLNQTYPTKTKK